MGVGLVDKGDGGFQKEYTDKDGREANRLGYGEGYPPFFSSVFLICLHRDRETGGILDVSFQTDKVDAALEKIKDRMGVERMATRYDVIAACRELVSAYDANQLGEQTSERVMEAIDERDRLAHERLKAHMNEVVPLKTVAETEEA